MYTVKGLAEATGWSREAIIAMAKGDDPLPIYYPPGKTRGGIVFRDDFKAWMQRNGKRYTERKD